VLKQPVEEEIQNIPYDMQRKVMADVHDTVEECLRKGGSLLTKTGDPQTVLSIKCHSMIKSEDELRVVRSAHGGR
jgi:hypothetical protein